MTKVERFRFIRLLEGVADLTGEYDPSTHVSLSSNPFAALLADGGQADARESVLIEYPGMTRKSVAAMRSLLHHLLDEPETRLKLRFAIIAVEVEYEKDTMLIDHYYVVMTDTTIYLCHGGCNYHDEGMLGNATLDTLFEGLSRALGQQLGRYAIPLSVGSGVTDSLSDAYDEGYQMQQRYR